MHVSVQWEKILFNFYVLRKLVRFFFIKIPVSIIFHIQFNIQLSSEIAISIIVS